jgi:hypothetical protein
MLEQAMPPNFRGFVRGDLLYTEKPLEESGALKFKPNTIEYNIPLNTKLGEEIADSDVGIAVHTYYKGHDTEKQPIGNLKFKPVPGLLLIKPVRAKENVRGDRHLVRELKELARNNGNSIDTLFNPAELRQLEITNLPRLCVDYINSLVHDGHTNEFAEDTLIPGFGKWLQENVSRRKYRNIVEYLQSPRSNMEGICSAFAAFVLLHKIKMDLLKQLDHQHPGHEGWVIATPAGMSKLVNRFGYTRENRRNNS